MKNRIFRKGFLLGIEIIFLGIAVSPYVNGNIVIEKNTLDAVNSQIFDNSDAPIELARYGDYLFGPIYNFSYDEDNDTYVFESKNMRSVFYMIMYLDGDFYWAINYGHSHDRYFKYDSNFNFRGIIRPTFICGHFYFKWS